MVVIELIQLSKWYGEVIGLNNVTAEIGPSPDCSDNGGQSTLMGMALEASTQQGRVRFRRIPGTTPGAFADQCAGGRPFWSNRLSIRRVLAKMSGLGGAAARSRAGPSIEPA